MWPVSAAPGLVYGYESSISSPWSVALLTTARFHHRYFNSGATLPLLLHVSVSTGRHTIVMSNTSTEPEHARSGPFTRDELRLPSVDRWTPLRILLYPITAIIFWFWLVPAAVLIYIVSRVHNLIQSPSKSSPSPSYVAPLQPTDLVWLHDKPTNHNIITAILVLSSPPLPYQALLSLIHDRILVAPGMERLQCRIDQPGRRWLRDEQFALREHVTCWPHWKLGSQVLLRSDIELDEDGGCVDGDEWSEEGCSRALQRLLASVVNSPIQSRSGRPSLWSFTLLPGYGPGSVIIFRAHHVLADGVLLSGVLLEMMMDPTQPTANHASTATLIGEQPRPHATSTAGRPALLSSADATSSPLLLADAGNLSSHAPPAPPIVPSSSTPTSATSSPTPSTASVRSPSISTRIRHRLRFLLALLTSVVLGPLHLIALSFHSDDFNPLHHARSLSVHKSVHWSTHPVSLHRVKRIGKWYGASVNDVMMSVMVGAIDRATADSRSSMRARSLQSDMHFLVPINVRPLLSLTSSHRLGNLFAVLILGFPVTASSPRGRLLRMTRQMNGVKRSPLPLMMFVSLYLTTALLPASWSGALLDLYNDMCSGILTNNKSPSQWLYCAGRRLEQWVSWAPCRGRCGCSMTLLSYAGSMRVSVVMDRAVEERVAGDELLRLYEDEFRRLERGVPVDFMAVV